MSQNVPARADLARRIDAAGRAYQNLSQRVAKLEIPRTARCPSCVNPDCDALAVLSVDRAWRTHQSALARSPEDSPYQLPPSLRHQVAA